MTRELLLICIMLFVIPMGVKLVYGQNAGGQVNATNPHFENIFQQRLGSNYTANLIIIYQSPIMVVLKGDLVSASPGSSYFKTNYNDVFWHGIEILHQEFGFALDKLVVNGFGSVINPERMYAVMIKSDVK
ncbi:MAG: hypothetical protein ACHQXG_06965 [Nitrososphaerales archaeon]